MIILILRFVVIFALNLTQIIMKRKPLKYNSSEVATILKLSSRSDKLGHVFYMVEFGDDDYVCFCNLSSAMDFIETNFK